MASSYIILYGVGLVFFLAGIGLCIDGIIIPVDSNLDDSTWIALYVCGIISLIISFVCLVVAQRMSWAQFFKTYSQGIVQVQNVQQPAKAPMGFVTTNTATTAMPQGYAYNQSQYQTQYGAPGQQQMSFPPPPDYGNIPKTF